MNPRPYISFMAANPGDIVVSFLLHLTSNSYIGGSYFFSSSCSNFFFLDYSVFVNDICYKFHLSKPFLSFQALPWPTLNISLSPLSVKPKWPSLPIVYIYTSHTNKQYLDSPNLSKVCHYLFCTAIYLAVT